MFSRVVTDYEIVRPPPNFYSAEHGHFKSSGLEGAHWELEAGAPSALALCFPGLSVPPKLACGSQRARGDMPRGLPGNSSFARISGPKEPQGAPRFPKQCSPFPPWSFFDSAQGRVHAFVHHSAHSPALLPSAFPEEEGIARRETHAPASFCPHIPIQN